MKNIPFNCKLFTRALIALLFIVAGLSKIGALGGGKPLDMFKGFYMQLPQIMHFIPVSFAPLAGVLVVLIEIPIALLYAFGYKKNWTGGTLIAFTAMTVLFVHFPFKGGHLDFMNLIQSLKNIAIIGGIVATLDCACTTCTVARASISSHHKENHSK